MTGAVKLHDLAKAAPLVATSFALLYAHLDGWVIVDFGQAIGVFSIVGIATIALYVANFALIGGLVYGLLLVGDFLILGTAFGVQGFPTVFGDTWNLSISAFDYEAWLVLLLFICAAAYYTFDAYQDAVIKWRAMRRGSTEEQRLWSR